MTITFPLTLPTFFRQWTLGAKKASSIVESPTSFKDQIYSHPGEKWRLILTYPPLQVDQARELQAFLLSLNGHEGTFAFGDRNMPLPRGAVSGTPTVSGGGQTGKTLTVGSLTPSTTGIFKAGDYIQVGVYLHMVLKDVNSDGSGVATLDIFPRLRASPSNGASITISSPKGLFRLEDPNVAWSAGKEGVYDFSFSAIEAL